MPKQSKNEVLGTLLRFAAKLRDKRADFPHLEVTIARLLSLVELAQEAAAEQASFTASKQAASKRLDGYLSGGLRLLTVLKVTLREHYGIRSEQLAEFGIQPFRRRPRKTQPVEEPAPEVEPVTLRTEALTKAPGSEP